MRIFVPFDSEGQSTITEGQSKVRKLIRRLRLVSVYSDHQNGKDQYTLHITCVSDIECIKKTFEQFCAIYSYTRLPSYTTQDGVMILSVCINNLLGSHSKKLLDLPKINCDVDLKFYTSSKYRANDLYVYITIVDVNKLVEDFGRIRFIPSICKRV